MTEDEATCARSGRRFAIGDDTWDVILPGDIIVVCEDCLTPYDDIVVDELELGP